MPEYRQGVGPNRLPQGGAQRLNAATPRIADESDDIPIQYAPDERPRPLDTARLGESKQVLLSPPNPDFAATVVPQDRPGRVPRYVVSHLPELAAAVRDPGAPPTLKALYRAILRQLELERAQGGG